MSEEQGRPTSIAAKIHETLRQTAIAAIDEATERLFLEPPVIAGFLSAEYTFTGEQHDAITGALLSSQVSVRVDKGGPPFNIPPDCPYEFLPGGRVTLLVRRFKDEDGGLMAIRPTRKGDAVGKQPAMAFGEDKILRTIFFLNSTDGLEEETEFYQLFIQKPR